MCEIGKDREDKVLVQTWRHILLHFVTHTLPLRSSQPVDLTLGFAFIAGAPQLLNLQLKEVYRRIAAI